MSRELENLIHNKVQEIKEKNDAVTAISSLKSNEAAEIRENDFNLLIITKNSDNQEKTERVQGKKGKLLYTSKRQLLGDLKTDNWYVTYKLLNNSKKRYDPENILEDLEKEAEKIKNQKMEITEEKQNEISYELKRKKQKLDIQDVGQKRYLMYDIFDFMLLQNYYLNQKIPVAKEYRLRKLKQFDGYFYKLAQEFLTESSTAKKQRKLEKMADRIFNQLDVEKQFHEE